MTGREQLCATLRDLGVEHVFGLPGTQNAELFNLLPEHGIRPVLATHEGAAAFMANGYARERGTVAVLATIPGPGFTFAFPGLAEARLDSVPILHIVGTPSTHGGTRFQHQAIDQAGMAAPLAKAVVDVADAAEMDATTRRAHALAMAGEPGPVLLHVAPQALDGEAASVAGTRTDAEGAAKKPDTPWRTELVSRLNAAKRPLLFLGGGAAEAVADIRRLADTLPAPAFSTLSGRGILPEDHAFSLGFDPDRGRLAEMNQIVADADLVLALGCKMAHNGTAGFGLRLPAETLVHVNTDPLALGPNYPTSLSIEAGTGAVLAGLSDALDDPQSEWTAEKVRAHRAVLSNPEPPRLAEPALTDTKDPDPAAFFRALRATLPRDGILVTDTGLHQGLVRRYFDVLDVGGLQTPADFQSMGFGLPAALGAKLAAPHRSVVALIGDGGFLMSGMDLMCAARERIPVVVIVFNDGQLNLIRLQQLRDHGTPSAVDILMPDLETLAEAFGVSYGRIADDPERTLRSALESGGPALIEVRLGDSSGIRAMQAKGAARHFVRRTVGQSTIDRIKAMLGRGR